uniref:type II toxin-antitoxin system mRNA interferase toxin, RelE/StbE family n=1 Tax=Turicimonas muris TaxID=1796652 RepID=UPI00402A8B0C
MGNGTNHRELHIQSDWLLIYSKTIESIIAVRTGSHADLFEKQHHQDPQIKHKVV